MPRLNREEQLESYRRQQVELAKKINAAEVRRKRKAKAEDERRKLVLGAAVLAYFEHESRRDLANHFFEAVLRERKMSAADMSLFKDVVAQPTPANDAGRPVPAPSAQES